MLGIIIMHPDQPGSHSIVVENPTFNDGSDTIIWKAMQRGDKDALAKLYALFFSPLYNYGCRFADSDISTVEDCIQELFIELWDKRANIATVSKVKAYLFQCLRRKILYRLRNTHRRHLVVEEQFEIEISVKSHYLQEKIEKEFQQQVKDIIGTLSPKQKEAIFLIYYGDLTYEETADVMGLKLKTVYNLVHLGISELRRKKELLGRLLYFFVL